MSRCLMQRCTYARIAKIWDGVSDARITFAAHAGSSSIPGTRTFEMARLTENLNLQRALLQSLADRPVTILDNTKVSAIERDDSAQGGWPLVHTSNGSVLRARLLVRFEYFSASEMFPLKSAVCRSARTGIIHLYVPMPVSNPMDGPTTHAQSSRLSFTNPASRDSKLQIQPPIKDSYQQAQSPSCHCPLQRLA
jgi:hypothetical protein